MPDCWRWPRESAARETFFYQPQWFTDSAKHHDRFHSSQILDSSCSKKSKLRSFYHDRQQKSHSALAWFQAGKIRAIDPIPNAHSVRRLESLLAGWELQARCGSLVVETLRRSLPDAVHRCLGVLPAPQRNGAFECDWRTQVGSSDVPKFFLSVAILSPRLTGGADRLLHEIMESLATSLLRR